MSLRCLLRRGRGWVVFLGLLVAAAAGPSDAASLRKGDLILTDRSADPSLSYDPRGGLFLIGPDSTVSAVPLASPNGFVNPVASVVRYDGKIVVVDTDADAFGDGAARGALFLIDPALPLPGIAEVFAKSRFWDNPNDVLEEPTGDFLVLDSDADPLLLGTRPGALFRVSKESREVTMLAASVLFADPRSMVFDIDGKVLIWDQRANPQQLPGQPGALFRVDPSNGMIETVFSFAGVFTDPIAIAIDANGDYLILDRDANPDGYPDVSPGAIFRVQRIGLTVTPAFTSPVFVEPYDFLVDPSGDAWVVDRRAFVFAGQPGALFRCNLASGLITRTDYSSYFRELVGLTQFAGTPLDASTVTCEDLSGDPLEPADRVRVRPRLHNSSGITQPVTLTHQVTPLWDYRVGSESTSTGTISFDPITRSVVWSGDVPSGGDVEFSYEIRLRDEVPQGTAVEEAFNITIPGLSSVTNLTYGAVVVRRATPGRIVWTDYETFAGHRQGMILERVEGVNVPIRVFTGPPLVYPEDLVFLPTGEILILDRLSYPHGPSHAQGGIYRIDPAAARIDTLVAFEDYPSLLAPAGIAAGAEDRLLIIDKDANPSGYPGSPGAVFELNLSSLELRLVASSPLFSDPVDAVVESTGLILVIDSDANPTGLQPHAGALFEIDPSTSLVRALPHPSSTFVDPIGVTEGLDRKVFITDISANPLHLSRNTGCVFVVDRLRDNAVRVLSADTLFVDPADVITKPDGTLIVTDRDANPTSLPPRDYGAVFQIARGGGRPTIYSASSVQYGPQGVAIFTGGDLRASTADMTDLNGPPALQGDTLRTEILIRNTGALSVPEAMASVFLSSHLSLIDAVGPGNLTTDPGLPGLSWIGPILPGQDIGITIRSRIDLQGVEFGQVVFNRLELSGPPSSVHDSVGVRVVAPLGTGDMVLVDSDADPAGSGSARGALYLVRSSSGATDLVLPSSPEWVDPWAIEGFDGGQVLIADPMGASPGRVLLVDYLHEETRPIISDPRLGSPSDLLRIDNGDLLIVDPQASLTPQGRLTPVVFVQRAGQQELSILTQGPPLAQPLQVAEDDLGRLWLVDRTADPNGAVPGAGALFRIDPATGAIMDTLQSPQFMTLSGVTAYEDQSLLVVDSGTSVSSGKIGALFRVDPDQNTVAVMVTDYRFIQLRNATVSASGDIWLVDRSARDSSRPGFPHVVFRFNPMSRHLDTVPLPADCVTPAELYALPSPEPRFLAYGYEDVNGPPLQAGDELLFRARVGNVGVKPTLGAAYQDTLPQWVTLDPATIQFDTGSVQTVEGENLVIWTMDLPTRSSYEISYRGRLRADSPQGQSLRFRSHMRTVEGVHRIRRIESRLPVTFDDGFIYLADGDADPLGFGSQNGTLWKIDPLTWQLMSMGSATSMKQPVNTLVLPALKPEILLVDSSANPMGYPTGRGALWRWNPENTDFGLVVADPTFRNPRTAVALSDHELLLLDSEADPFDYGPGLGPGAVYYVDVQSKSVQPYYSDSLIATPRDIVLDGRGGLFVIDANSDPGNFGFQGGAIYRLDLLQKRVTLYAASADFREPVAGAIGPDGMLYVLDRDVQLTTTRLARGGIFRIDRMGNAEIYATSTRFRRPTHLAFTESGGLLVCDEIADPAGFREQHGAMFLQQHPGGEFGVSLASRSTTVPGGFFVRDSLTPIEVTGFEATPLEEGIRLRWQVPEARFEGFICMRATGTDPEAENFRFLNPDDPVPGGGPWEYLDTDLSPGEAYAYKIGAILPGGGMRFFGPVAALASQVKPFVLFPAAPNPAAGATTLSFRIPQAGRTELRVFDLSGRLVRILLNELLRPGRQSIVWDGRNDQGHRVASGLYFVRLHWTDRAGKGRTANGRVILLR